MLLSENNRTDNSILYMHFSLISIPYFILLLSCGNSRTSHQYLPIDSAFIAWNKSTFLSLKSRISSATDSTEKDLYQNRLLAFESFVDINDENDVNIKSIRYQFFKKAVSNETSSRFYIIEANNSGEVVELRNFLIDPDKGIVDVYNFIDHQWVKSTTEKKNLKVDSNFRDYSTDFGSGINQDDVVVTLFNNGQVHTAEYYLYTTLSESSPWAWVLLRQQ